MIFPRVRMRIMRVESMRSASMAMAMVGLYLRPFRNPYRQEPVEDLLPGCQVCVHLELPSDVLGMYIHVRTFVQDGVACLISQRCLLVHSPECLVSDSC